MSDKIEELSPGTGAAGEQENALPGDLCFKCGAPLEEDAPGAYMRFVDRGAGSYLCLKCLSAQLGCTEGYLQDRIDFLRDNGCLLFPKKKR